MDLQCDKCGWAMSYNERYDAYYCAKCNEWKEKKCTDENCNMCIKREEKPLKKR